VTPLVLGKVLITFLCHGSRPFAIWATAAGFTGASFIHQRGKRVRAMLEKPFQLAAKMAAKVQHVATKVAQKSARVAQAAARKAERITMAARVKAAEAERLRAIRAARKPRVQFIRDLRHGRMRFSFYRSIDRRGEVHEFWTLSRETARGAERLATGSKEEFRSVRALTLQTLRETHGQGQARKVKASQVQGTKQATKASHEIQKPARREQLRESATEQKTAKQWHSLCYVEASYANGTAKTRVVRNFDDVKKAEAATAGNPKLVVYREPSDTPRRQGTIIQARKRDFLQLSKQARAPRPATPGNEPTQVNQPQHVNGKVLAEDQERGASPAPPAASAAKQEAQQPPRTERKGPERQASARSAEKTPETGEHRYWIAGVWHGAKPPGKGQWLWFAKGKTDVQERVMTPVQGETKTPGPGKPAHYVLAKIVSQGNGNPGLGTAVVVGSTKDKDYAVNQAETRERRAQSIRRQIERQPEIRRRDLAREYGISIDP
jgi:hypothetical protein